MFPRNSVDALAGNIGRIVNDSFAFAKPEEDFQPTIKIIGSSSVQSQQGKDDAVVERFLRLVFQPVRAIQTHQ